MAPELLLGERHGKGGSRAGLLVSTGFTHEAIYCTGFALSGKASIAPFLRLVFYERCSVFVGGVHWGCGVLFLSCVCVSVSGVLVSVGVCVCV